MTKWLVPALTGLLLLVPAAQAHMVVDVSAPAAPIPPMATTPIPIDAHYSCVEIAAFYAGAMGLEEEITLSLASTAPTWLTYVPQVVNFPYQDCADPGGDQAVHGIGAVPITPGPLAPAFQPVTLTATTTPGGGEQAFNITVGYYAILTADEVPHLHTGDAFNVVLNLTSNGDTELLFGIESHGEFVELTGLPASLQVDSPLLDGKASRMVTLDLSSVATDLNFTTEEMHLTVQAYPKGDTSVLAASTGIHLAFMPPHEGEHDGHEDEQPAGEGEKKTPTLGLGLLLTGLAALALRRRT